jgi:hypothetical protein
MKNSFHVPPSVIPRYAMEGAAASSSGRYSMARNGVIVACCATTQLRIAVKSSSGAQYTTEPHSWSSWLPTRSEITSGSRQVGSEQPATNANSTA